MLKILIHDDVGDIHYIDKPFLKAKHSLCGEWLDSISTVKMNDKHAVSCVRCLEIWPIGMTEPLKEKVPMHRVIIPTVRIAIHIMLFAAGFLIGYYIEPSPIRAGLGFLSEHKGILVLIMLVAVAFYLAIRAMRMARQASKEIGRFARLYRSLPPEDKESIYERLERETNEKGKPAPQGGRL